MGKQQVDWTTSKEKECAEHCETEQVLILLFELRMHPEKFLALVCARGPDCVVTEISAWGEPGLGDAPRYSSLRKDPSHPRIVWIVVRARALKRCRLHDQISDVRH